VDGGAPEVARTATGLAACTSERRRGRLGHPVRAEERQLRVRQLVCLGAGRADLAHEALGQDAEKCLARQVAVPQRVHQARDGPGSVIGVQTADDEMPGHRGVAGGGDGGTVGKVGNVDDVGVGA